MRAYKFLRRGRIGPFSEHAWPEREWVHAEDDLDRCRNGIHACRPDQLAYWLADELWEVELAGDILETELKVVAARGRLVARIDAWDDGARQDFAQECVRRTAAYAVAELRRGGLARAADDLDAGSSPAEIAQACGAALHEATQAGLGDGADLVAFVNDAVEYADSGDTAGTAFVAAHAAVVHGSDDGDAFGHERSVQGAWLCARLGLSP